MQPIKRFSFAISILILLLAVFTGLFSLRPHRIIDENAAADEFSTYRALQHLKIISEKPHFVGTAYHDKVRDYIVSELKKLGLEVTVQKKVAFNKESRDGSTVENIVARIKGTGKGKALLIMSHYDSAPTSSFGASDAGSGVVAILESVRAYLQTGEKPVNDIILLFTDAEELGLLGANAFVKHHPWAKKTGLVINLEARGSGGPALMMLETDKGNKNLIKYANKSNPSHPVANSILYTLYRIFPNDSDLMPFRESLGIDGYNLVFIDDHFDYHTAHDTYERLDKATLQQQGGYLLPMLRFFSKIDLDKLPASEEYVFFSFPGLNLIHFPYNAVLPLTVFALIWFVALLIVGFLKKRLTIKQILKGVFVFALAMKVPDIMVYLGLELFRLVYPHYEDIKHGFPYNGHVYVASFIALTLGYCFWIYERYFKKNRVGNLMVSPLVSWIAINFGIALFYPGIGYFILPVYISLSMMTILLFTDHLRNYTILFSLMVTPVIIVFTPLIHMIPIGLGIKMTTMSATLTVLIFSLLIPIFYNFRNVKQFSYLLFFLAIGGLITAAATSSFNKARKFPNSIVYVIDKDDNNAYWATYNTVTDTFTNQFLGTNPNEGTFLEADVAKHFKDNFTKYTKAPAAAVPPPVIEVIKDSIEGKFRKIHLKISPGRMANSIVIHSNNVMHIKTFNLNGEAVKPEAGNYYLFDTEDNKQILSYYLTPKDTVVDLRFSISKTEKPDLGIISISYDLFENPAIKKIKPDIKQRSENMMPMPFVLTDAVVTFKRIQL